MWGNRGFRERVLGELRHLHRDMAELNRLIRLDLGVDMTTNDELKDVDAKLTEAATEIPAKIDELIAQAGDAVDPELVADLKAKASALADIVPNAEPDPSPETPAEPTPDE